MTRAVVVASIVAASLALAGQQTRDGARPPVTGTAQIAGTVMTPDRAPVPVRRATIVLTGDRLAERLVAVTDDNGAFAFTSLPADRYALSASKAGYVPMNYGSKRPGGSGTPIAVAEGQRATAAMTLVRGSVITGTVRDGLGRPLPDVTVSAMRYAVSFVTGERVLDSVSIGSAGSINSSYLPDAFPGTAMTDDRGEYRIYGLAAGEYIVSASVRPPRGSPNASTDVYQISAADVQRAAQLLRGSNVGAVDTMAMGGQPGAGSSRVDYAPVYHPAAIAREDAGTVTLGPAEERPGVDVQVRLVPTANLSGTVTTEDGSPVSNAQVSVMHPRSSDAGVFRFARSNLDGEFFIPGIPPGRYEIWGSAYADGLTGMTEVMLEGRDVPASFVMSPGVSVSGRIVFEGKTKAPAFTTVPPILRRHAWVPTGQRYELLPDGRFIHHNVPPGAYKLAPGRPPAGWVLRSVMVNGLDASDVSFEIKAGQNIENVVVTLTDQPAEISGVLQNAAGEPAPDYVLIVFSADSRYWVPRTRRTQQVRPDINGRFIARDLPAGDYLIAAVTDLEDGQWNDPAFLAALAVSSPVKIAVAEGDRKVQDIRIGR
jgi:protocatechuate 3,4-dioxygenase beta subunit